MYDTKSFRVIFFLHAFFLFCFLDVVDSVSRRHPVLPSHTQRHKEVGTVCPGQQSTSECWILSGCFLAVFFILQLSDFSKQEWDIKSNYCFYCYSHTLNC